ncbi:helix-turn-helix transcriptional regulator [Nocardia yunnanensis]|uniref:Helix-turn-helix transcriptional regulator n=1 Tax=Nocardia yunnanensis TaxID=2382165 RepID=A0A386Z5V7_9NOCA|nr:LuxR family transcriptional regulator [Nocardia yunnanensis]AYF72613.1 helix-turn-helix transcriptional regulator [Nocardia yunnanensis]
MWEDRKLYGRERELIHLERVLATARSGRGIGLVLHGDPAIGKTALLDAAADRAADFRILRCQGMRTESELRYATLHELLLPVADRLRLLPAPQARALRAVLGLEAGTPDAFLVGAALVRLLSTLAAERPLLLVVDAAGLVDAESGQSLVFAVRRLSGSPVALLAGLRDDPAGTAWRELAALPITGLPDTAARGLVTAEHGPMGALRLSRILATAGGNPLALHELPTVVDDLAGTAAQPVPLGPNLRTAFRERVAALPDDVRVLLTVAATETRGVLGAVTDAAAALGVGPAAWERAAAAGLLTVGDGRVERTHALLCAAAHDAATPAQRRATHLALADALIGAAEADLRVWHRAMAADRPDEPLAAMLAQRAADAGHGALTAATMMRQAAAISADPERAGERLALAGRFAWAGGDIASARGLLDRATARLGPERAAVASSGLAGLLEFVAGEPERASRLLLRDAELVDAPTAANLRLDAERARWAAGHGVLDLNVAEISVRESISRFHTMIRPLPPAPLVLLWGLADIALEPYTQAAAGLRGSAAPAAVSLLPQLAIVQFANGRFADAEQTLAEAFELAEAGGVENVLAHCWALRTKISALHGDSEAVLDSAERVLALARPRRAQSLIASAHWHLGFHALSLGDPENAYLRLRTLAQPGHDARHPTYSRLAALDLVEAATRVGRPAEALEYYTDIRDWAIRSRADWAVSAAYACRALLCADDRADHYFRRALAVRRSRHDLNHVRTQLLYGKWLRRARRRADAAEQLRSAAEAFERMGAQQWALRARQELELTGRRAAPVTAHGETSVLTAQELRVARLAAQGLTNREIGTELFLSPRTVGHHLSRVFGKLGLSGRADLVDVDFDNGMRIVRPR